MSRKLLYTKLLPVEEIGRNSISELDQNLFPGEKRSLGKHHLWKIPKIFIFYGITALMGKDKVIQRLSNHF